MPNPTPTPPRIAELREKLERILAANPQADADNVWHTLLLLEKTPIERLRRSLLRGRNLHLHR